MDSLAERISIAAQVLDRITQDARRYHDEHSAPLAHSRSFDSSVQLMRRKVWVNAHWNIAWPHWPPGLSSKIVALYQKSMRRLLAWYINPIVRQQNEFNRAALGAIQALAKEVLDMRARQSATQPDTAERLDAITAQVENLQMLFEQSRRGQV